MDCLYLERLARQDIVFVQALSCSGGRFCLFLRNRRERHTLKSFQLIIIHIPRQI